MDGYRKARVTGELLYNFEYSHKLKFFAMDVICCILNDSGIYGLYIRVSKIASFVQIA
jgi:hypothetical protein